MNLRNAVPLLGATLLATALLHGCGDPKQDESLAQGGVDASVGHMTLDDVWVAAPHGVAAGGSAPLHMAIANESGRPDALVGVSSPVAGRVVLERAGHPVARLTAAPGQLTDLERSRTVVLEGVRRPLHVGEWLPITFQFARAGGVTVSVTVGPLGARSASITNPQHGGAS